MSTTIKEDLEMIIEKLDRLERMIGKHNSPFEYMGDNTPQPNYPGYGTTCTKCRMVFTGVTSYYCPDNNCPSFIKPTC